MKCVSLLFWWLNSSARALKGVVVVGWFLAGLPAGADSLKIYDLVGSWQNQDGKTVSLSSLKGKKSVFALFYTRCKTICPMTAKSLKTIEKSLGPSAKSVQFILVSIDPSNDNTTQMQNFKTENKTSGWTLLAGDLATTKKLAAMLGTGFGEKRANPDLHQMHSRLVTIVGEDGTVKAQWPLAELDAAKARQVLADQEIARQE